MLFGTAAHSLTFTARKSDLLNVSKSTSSSNKGSTFTLEKSIFALSLKNPLLSFAVASSTAPDFPAFCQSQDSSLSGLLYRNSLYLCISLYYTAFINVLVLHINLYQAVSDYPFVVPCVVPRLFCCSTHCIMVFPLY